MPNVELGFDTCLKRTKQAEPTLVVQVVPPEVSPPRGPSCPGGPLSSTPPSATGTRREQMDVAYLSAMAALVGSVEPPLHRLKLPGAAEERLDSSAGSAQSLAELHSRVDHGANVTVLQNHSSVLPSSPDGNIHHGTGQVVGANYLVGEQHAKHRVDSAQQAVAKIRLLPRLYRVDVRGSEDVHTGEPHRQ